MSGDKYIALDVHQATTVTSVLNAAGREVNRALSPPSRNRSGVTWKGFPARCM